MNFKEELIVDVRKKIEWCNKYNAEPKNYLCPDETCTKEEFLSAQDAADRHNKQNQQHKISLRGTLIKIRALKQNPSTIAEKRLWIEIMDELRSDFGYSHSSRNRELGWAGDIILRYVFDMEKKG